MPDSPLFSILIVCLNARAYVAQALDSVLAQGETSYEVLIIDGASTDGTVDIVRGYENRFGGRLRWFSEPDDGLYEAMNKGLHAATGYYVVSLGADDRLVPGALSTVAGTARSNGWPDIIAGATHVVGAAREWTQVAQRYGGNPVPKRPPAVHQSLFARRTAMLEAGGFDTTYRIAADYDQYLKLLDRGAREVLIPQVLSEFRLGGVSSSNTG
ncbi:MAG: glycosyltransferase, partial [Coriobacteriia bacterium]|nr:glycosyltransferase [Coriobacteriia bacterium]